MASTAGSKERRWEFLDAVRGFAAIAVVLQHFLERLFPAFGEFATNVWSPGRFGVVIFFLVSGFLVPRSLEVKNDLKEFWKSRFWRLFPLYWFNLMTVSIAGLLGWIDIHQFNPLNIKHFVLNAVMLQDILRVPTFNLMSWTLGMEMVLYILVSVFFHLGLLTRTRLILATILGGLVVVSVLMPTVLHMRFPAGSLAVFGSILSGLALYRWQNQQLSRNEAYFWQLISVLAIGIAAVFNYSNSTTEGSDLHPSQFCAIFSAVTGFLFFDLLLHYRTIKFPKWVLWLGLVSYSTYLLHGTAIQIVGERFNPYVSLVLQLAITLAISWFAFTFIEKPGIEMGRKKKNHAQ